MPSSTSLEKVLQYVDIFSVFLIHCSYWLCSFVVFLCLICHCHRCRVLFSAWHLHDAEINHADNKSALSLEKDKYCSIKNRYKLRLGFFFFWVFFRLIQLNLHCKGYLSSFLSHVSVGMVLVLVSSTCESGFVRSWHWLDTGCPWRCIVTPPQLNWTEKIQQKAGGWR